VACAFAAAAAATTEDVLQFSHLQFQPHSYKSETADYLLTVPLVYKGSISTKLEGIAKVAPAPAESYDKNLECVDSTKGSMPVYMTMCQPCLDCFPCQELGAASNDKPLTITKVGADVTVEDEKITKWNMYYVNTYKEDGVKQADIYKVDMIGAGYKFFTGSLKANALIFDEDDHDNEFNLWLSGKRSELTFKYYESLLVEDGGDMTWSNPVTTESSTAYISSMSSIKGIYNCLLKNDDLAPYIDLCVKAETTFKMSRNSSLTMKAIKSVFTGKTTYVPSGNKHWQDCGEDEYDYEPASFCEAYFTTGTAVEDDFDKYLVNEAYKNYDAEIIAKANLAEVLDTVFLGF